jgi:hypothetical protein
MFDFGSTENTYVAQHPLIEFRQDCDRLPDLLFAPTGIERDKRFGNGCQPIPTPWPECISQRSCYRVETAILVLAWHIRTRSGGLTIRRVARLDDTFHALTLPKRLEQAVNARREQSRYNDVRKNYDCNLQAAFW